MLDTIRQSGLSKRIRITGWTDITTFRHYLAAADVAVQLRTLSRGETSASVLDCMNYGIPTIVNANGSMADLAEDGVWKLPDEFCDNELVNALETLWREPACRQQLGIKAREIILTRHDPRDCADQYEKAIETMCRAAHTNVTALIRALACVEPPSDSQAWVPIAEAISFHPATARPPSVIGRHFENWSSVTRKLEFSAWCAASCRNCSSIRLEGFKVEPVYATTDRRLPLCTAVHFKLPQLSGIGPIRRHHRVSGWSVFLGLDLQPEVVPAQQAFFQLLRKRGVQVQFVVYDLLPINLPEAFTKEATKQHQAWLKAVAESDGAICISKAVAGELADWLKTNRTASPLAAIQD